MIIERIREIIEKNREKWKLKALFLFGSIAYGLATDNSDIDIAITFDNLEIGEEEKEKIVKDIKKKITQETQREVDVVEIDENFSRPMLFYNAIINGIPIFVKDENWYKRMILRAICEMEDFSNMGEKWKRKSCEILLKDIERWVKDSDTQREE
ncbi:MAG: type VII toxin-antitoxin system MntA family adenylyltransferase antitoxin [Thermosulfidibacteraceae bacterium]|jgi:predicted nucleotidyltransferase